MAIIGSDFHGNYDKVERFLNYLPKEKHVFAGDILDSFYKSSEQQLRCLETLLASKCELLWGNHENNYRKIRQPCSGFKWQWYDTFCRILEGNKQRFKVARLVDDYIVTHAGIGEDFEEFDDYKLQVKELNSKNSVLPINQVGVSRGGYHPQGGPFWFDHIRDGKLAKKYNQVFGHTSSEEPVEYKGEHLGKSYHHVCVNTWDDNDRVFVFNTKTKMVEEVI